LTRGTDVIKADRMETSKFKDRVKAKGKVELLRSLPEGDKLKAYGSEAFYNPNEGDGYILRGKKQAHIIHNQVLSSTSARQIDIYANRFDFSEVASTGTARGEVYGKSKDPDQGEFEFWSDEAHMSQTDKSIHLTGTEQPRVRQVIPGSDRMVAGDSITYFYDGRSFEARGRAQAVFIDSKQQEK
jgi:lipopolysaccharide export system protein LptA